MSCPLTPETRHLVNAERIALMKPTAYLINTARGPIVDQKALTKVLQERRIAGAGLDVLEQEPPDPDDPILKLDNVILAPHALCWTDQCFAGNGAADVRAVLEVQHGRDAARRRQPRRARIARPGRSGLPISASASAARRDWKSRRATSTSRLERTEDARPQRPRPETRQRKPAAERRPETSTMGGERQ